MADEITPEQWRAWGENPCTKRLVEKTAGQIAVHEEAAKRHRARGLEEFDRGGGGPGALTDARRMYYQEILQASTLRLWLGAILHPTGMPAPRDIGTDDTPPAGRRVIVKG